MWPFSAKRESAPARIGIERRVVRAKFDAAQTTTDNVRHWRNADGLSADAAASLDVRTTLRNRARYEVFNNSYARGIILTLANDCIGTGPRLQMLSDDANTNAAVERAFNAWSRQIGLAQKLRTMKIAKATDGESFAVLTRNRAGAPIELDIQLVECDRVTTPVFTAAAQDPVDGIRFDADGNPIRYTILRHHPGQVTGSALGTDFNFESAKNVIHWFRADRPGQHRGLPEIMPALPLFAQLRRYTLAVLGAAETAADFAAVLYTDSPANGESAAVEPMDVVELEQRMATVLPDGWKLGQLKAEQPATTYAEFKKELLNEIARCFNMPFNVAAGNSSGYNFASGRLDHQTYFKSIRVEQSHMAEVVLDKIFDAWVREAMLTSELSGLRRLESTPHQWFFDGTEHVDPAKEATAQATRLSNNTTTLAYEFARQGKDWEVELRQRAKELALMSELGISLADADPFATPSDFEDEQDA